MSIVVSNTDVTVSGQSATFEDIYQAAVQANKTQYVNKLGNTYILKGNLKLSSNATVSDVNKNIIIEGQYIQIPYGCTLKLGLKDSLERTTDGCTFSAPNILLAYGFGNTNVNDSGNLFLYNSIINVYGYWGFFKGDNNVEIINCFIDGFGRISGINSVVRNVIFKKSHGRYGCMSTKGNIKEYNEVTVLDSVSYTSTNSTTGATWTTRASLYHNPDFAPIVNIYNGTFDNYDELVYVEPSSISNIITLYGSEVKKGYNIKRLAVNNLHEFYHKFKFNVILQESDGDIVSNANITIKNRFGTVVYSGVSGYDGSVDIYLTYYEDKASNNLGGVIHTPHTVTVTKDTVVYENIININRNIVKAPYVLAKSSGGSGGDVDYDRIQDMINVLSNDICGCTTLACDILDDKINSVEEKIDLIVDNTCKPEYEIII